MELEQSATLTLEHYTKIHPNMTKQSHNVVLCESIESFNSFLSTINPKYFNFQGYYLIVIPGRLYEYMSDMFATLWSLHIVNVNLLPLTRDDDDFIYTYYPFTSLDCGSTLPVQLDYYRDGKWMEKNELFPNKMKDLFNCTLSVVTFDIPPFIKIDKEKEDSPSGIEVMLMNVLALKMNFNIKWIYSEELWGKAPEHEEPTGKSN
ncbi:CLUMA_CG011030, isoform A [Clunio marinus]|uniref:CLUMA_CG011030, isoform A n=1 Tax=Clunio marinus TaxID=568069 RepID=A0A1J1IBJ7_9DIPT|nr:CLUMA_CG011030, isoform A [Clunio marinus]